MRIKSVLHLVIVMVVGQLLFACNSAKYYEFSAHKQAPYLNQPKQKAAPANEGMVSLSEVALAAADQRAEAEALATAAPVLEANAADVAPLVAPKKVAPVAKVAATPEVAAEATMTEAEAMAMAKERIASMTKAEKKALKKEFRETMRQSNSSVSTVVKVIIAIFLPPLAVFLHDGIGSSFWINILLTLLFFVPGVIHALLVVTDTI
ncbi:YqaE/Pmp3 family membrane protein [Pontibacter qinzhouensis]|uniref:YqaE/Pmp3 family membrane protein n=1 Tax=Pontibacter qinzhouensis TaxID=2603253 RepID=UPI0021038F66